MWYTANWAFVGRNEVFRKVYLLDGATLDKQLDITTLSRQYSPLKEEGMRKLLRIMLTSPLGIAVLAAVVGAVVGTVLTFFAPQAIPAAWAAVASVCSQAYAWLSTGHSLPGWGLLLLFLLAGCTAVCAGLLGYAAMRPGPSQPRYSNDLIEGVLWRWEVSRPVNRGPYPFCPNSKCDAQLVYREGDYSAAGPELYCENCRRVVAKCGTDTEWDYEAKAEREIRRRDRVGRSQTTPQSQT